MTGKAQTIASTQQQNARASGYAIVASRNPGKSFTVLMIKWDGINTLEYNANKQINSIWHPQAVVKGNSFDQAFEANSFSMYSSVLVSEAEFDKYKSTGTDWWIVCSPMPSFSNSSLNVLPDGNVGIGTTTTGVYKLAVEGSIAAREVKVQASGWADFVFKKEYNLPTLQEVEKHIVEKGHLENIPSEEEVLKGGINLGEMNAKLLQKIEELTLYLIEEEKKNKIQSEEIEKSNKKIELLIIENKDLKSISDRLSQIEQKIK